ncbi:hypothetical protein MJO29_008066 [Puccinia striiformis f. sp. tritici]|nr:hypothetical protein MJO29_008066 [Puccinia striiformis f. sp. tritici]
MPNKQPANSLQQRNSTSQTTLVVNRSKINLHKKRPTGLSRNNTSLTLSKTSTLTHQSKQSGKPARKGAFKGALDPEPDDSETQQESHQPKPHHPHHPLHHREEEVWVSEPSTRCTTPIHSAQPPLPEISQTITSAEIELEQLAIPLASIPKPQPSAPSTSQLVPFPAATSPLSPNPDQDLPPASDPEPETRGRSKSRHRNHDSEARSVRSEVSLTKPPPQPLETLPATTTAVLDCSEPVDLQSSTSSSRPGGSPQQTLSKGKARASTSSHKPPSGKRSSINSVRSLSSLVIHHNDSLMKSTSSRRGLKRVDSAASVVLPPKIDTTEAVITMNGKATFNPTLMSILDFPTEPLPGQSESTPNTAICSPLATTSKIPFPSRRLLSDPNHYQPTCTADERSKAGHSSKALSGGLDESECARRLKKYSSTGRPLSHQINSKAANEFPSGLMNSLLSPGLTFKSRRSETHHSSHGGGTGYFNNFKSLVGISSLPEQLNESDNLTSKQDHQSSHHSESASSSKAGGTPAAPTSLQTKDATKAGINLNGVRYPFAQSQKLLGHPPPRQPKPTLPGFITTCGPVPVLSKFLGPQPANLSPPTNTQQTRPGTSNPSPSSDRPSASPDPPSQQTTPKQHGFENGRSQHQHQPQLTRIQKKLLMERDRPISPTGLYDDPTPPTSAGPISGTSTTSALPPPSYLIRSLGGQTGPLPFIPLNLLPADPALPKSTSSTATTTHLSPSHTCNTNNTDFIHHHHHSIDNSPRLNQPALKAKQALSIKLWRNSLIDEVEQVLTDHESNTRFRNPLFESLIRVAEFNSNLASHHHQSKSSAT